MELYEVRSLLGNARGSGQTAVVSRYGNYALHAKLFVFDRQKIFIGSMNFDQRSKRLNTEVGLIIDSPELARQTAARFDAMVQPANSYVAGAAPERVGRRTTTGLADTGRRTARRVHARTRAQRLATLEAQTPVAAAARQGTMKTGWSFALALIVGLSAFPIAAEAPADGRADRDRLSADVRREFGLRVLPQRQLVRLEAGGSTSARQVRDALVAQRGCHSRGLHRQGGHAEQLQWTAPTRPDAMARLR